MPCNPDGEIGFADGGWAAYYDGSVLDFRLWIMDKDSGFLL